MSLCPGLETTPGVGGWAEGETDRWEGGRTDRWVHRWKNRRVTGYRSAHPSWFPLTLLAGLGQIPWGWGSTEGWAMPGHPPPPRHEPAGPRQSQLGPHHNLRE